MSKISYEFELKKVACITIAGGRSLRIGDVEEYIDTNGQVKVTIKFIENLPKKAIEKIFAQPECITIAGQPSGLKNIKLIDFSAIELPN